MNGTAATRPNSSDPLTTKEHPAMTTSQASAAVGIGPGAAEPPVWGPENELDAAEEVTFPDAAPAAAPAPVSKTHVSTPARRGNSTSLLLVAAALIAVGGVGFAVGHATTNGQTATAQNGDVNGISGQFAAPSGIPGGGEPGGIGGAAAITGTVASVSADSITVQLASGATVTLATGSSTTYHNQTSGSSSDLAAGQTVQVQTSGGAAPGANASASAGTPTTRTATDVTITG
jgi:hypothetical protein